MSDHDRSWGWPTTRFGLAMGLGHDSARSVSSGRISMNQAMIRNDLDEARRAADLHEQMHSQGRERLVRRIALLAGTLTEAEWQQVVRAREDR